MGRPRTADWRADAALDRDRSNVNRALSALLELDLADRHRRLLDPGGYVYQYTAAPLPETKRRLHDGLDRWAETVHGRIEAFEEQATAGE